MEKWSAGVVVRFTDGAAWVEENTKEFINCLGLIVGDPVDCPSVVRVQMLPASAKLLNICRSNYTYSWNVFTRSIEYVGTLEELGLTKKDFYCE